MLVNLTLSPNEQCLFHLETSQLICGAKQLIGFYMRRTLVVKELNR